MKRDLQINYGVLDDIIGELRKYKRALGKMDDSLDKVTTFMQTNEGKSVEAWDQNISTSKEKIANYETQINDLLSLFENYVTDTTRYISPLSRNAMMRVDRNDIWANLKQIEGGITDNVFKALNKSYQQPASFFSMFDDSTDAEKEASEINRRHMERIQTSIESTQKKLQRHMDELWDLYHSKVKRFENADDEYNNLAGNVKRKYTNFFEGVWDVVSSINKAVDDLEKGFANSIASLVMGLLTVAKDTGVVVVSGIVPDPVEPSWLKDSASQTVDAYTQAALQFMQDPMRVVESTAQAFTDTVEQEGVMYATGAAVGALIPGSWAVKGASGVAKIGAGAARKAPKLLDSKPFSGSYYRKKIEAAKAGMAKVTEKFTFGKDYALSTGGATFIIKDKDFAVDAKSQTFNMQNGEREKVKTREVWKDTRIPSVRNNEFNKWFDNLSVEEFKEMWSDPYFRSKIEDRIRRPGGYHEWHLVARTPKFKQWGVSMDDIKEMRTLTKDVEFVNPPGRHGRRGSTKAHNEILKIIDSAPDYESFVRDLNGWASKRMKNGVLDLPEGLRR